MKKKLLVLNLPNPSHRFIDREYAGGFGIADFTKGISRKLSLNLFLPYSASVAEKVGWEYKIVDAQALGLSTSDTVYETKRANPDIVFSMISLPSIQNDVRLLDEIKRQLPHVWVVGCGAVCKVMPDAILSKSKIDLIFRAEVPYVSNLTDLLCKFELGRKKDVLRNLPGISFRTGSKVINNPIKCEEESIDNYFPSYEALQLNKYARFTDLEGKERLFIPILGSRGCPYNCVYCPYPIGFGRKLMFRSPKVVVDEIEHLYRSHGVNGFLFRNQSFTLSNKWARKVCNEILERKLEIAWFCEARVDEISKELLALMKKSGCKRIHYGVETGDPDLIAIGKPGVRLTTTLRAFNLTKKMGIWTHAHIIIGLPGENWKTLKTTCKFLSTLDPDSIHLNFATPYPGTELYRIAKENNWIVTHDWANYSSNDVVMRTEELSPNDLYNARFKITLDFFKRKVSTVLLQPFQLNSIRLLVKYYAPRVIGEKLRQLRGGARLRKLDEIPNLVKNDLEGMEETNTFLS